MRLQRFVVHGVAGMLTFAVTQYALIAHAGSDTAMEGGPGWFLNTGASLAILLAVVAAANAATSLFVPKRPVMLSALVFAGGASAAMAVTLAIIGPGNIFPIVLAIGGGLIAIAALVGGAAGALLRRLAGRVP